MGGIEDLSEISSEIIRDVLFETIKNQLKTNKFKVNLSSASKVGENNFTGIIYRVSFSNDDENDKSTSQLILKVAPQSTTRRQQFLARPAFVREIFTYDTILPALRKFEQSKGIEDGFTEYPKCYRTIDDDINECLFIEDLCPNGFSIIDRRIEEVTADHVFLVLNALGKMHAISFAMRDQQPDKFHELVSNLSEFWILRENDQIRGHLSRQCESVYESLSAKGDEEYLAKAKKFYEKDVLNVAADCVDYEGPATVISHGDSWQNNIMFKYDTDGKPIETSFIDWQATRHAAPIIDLVYFMFCCTTKKIRDDHYNDFLKVYHDSLSTHIRRLGSDPEKLYPFELMLKQFSKCGQFGLVLSTILLPMITSEDGNGIDIDEIAEVIQNGKQVDQDVFISENSRKKFLTRLREVVIDMVHLGYI